MAFQKCPICHGSGTEIGDNSFGEKTCSVCHGAKIIDTVTGLPPYEIKIETTDRIVVTDDSSK